MITSFKKIFGGIAIGVGAITTAIQFLAIVELLKYTQGHDALSILINPETAKLATIVFLIFVAQIISAVYGYDRYRKNVLLTPEKSKFIVEK